MNIDETQPIDQEMILYRCACGSNVEVSVEAGGVCDKCDRTVSPKVLNNHLAGTMTIVGPLKNLDSTTVDERDSDHDPWELVGHEYGHYEIVRPLGSGGSGYVYKALDTSLQRYVAVKVLKSARQLSDEPAESDEKCAEDQLLLQEAIAQARVGHPNIVPVYFVGTEKNEPFYAMELVDGISLSERIQEGEIEFPEICSLAEDMVRALAFSHELDTIHGDIKPSNILLCKTGGAKLSDFGLATRASDTKKLATGGTPNYLAPELLFGSSPSIQSDMYALGVTLFEMTFGKLPVELTGSTVANWQRCHKEQQVKFPAAWPENLPPQWRAFLNRLLAADPQNRYDSYESLSQDVKRLTPHSKLKASPLLRFIAASIDWIIVMLFMLPLDAAVNSDGAEALPVLQFVILILDFVPLVLYTFVVAIWKHSVGRKLMQLRVLNKFGMIPKGRKMVLRSILRMVLPWSMASSMMFVLVDDTWWTVIPAIISILTILFVIVNCCAMVFSKSGKAIHDRLFETQVVIDS